MRGSPSVTHAGERVRAVKGGAVAAEFEALRCRDSPRVCRRDALVGRSRSRCTPRNTTRAAIRLDLLRRAVVVELDNLHDEAGV
jgi:hypothetical protein